MGHQTCRQSGQKEALCELSEREAVTLTNKYNFHILTPVRIELGELDWPSPAIFAAHRGTPAP